ncbi:MAG: translocation/assembly module TamB, partial [Bacteroidota bacterium]
MPFVQTKIANYATNKLNTQYGTDINIDEVAITFFGGVKLKKVLILDNHKDTLIFSDRIRTSVLDFKQLVDGQLLFGDLYLDDFYLQIKNYKGDKDTNLDKFIAAFDDGTKGTGKFLMKSNNIYLKDSRFVMVDLNRPDPKDVEFTKLNAHLKDFKIKGPNVYTLINSMAFHDHRGVDVKNLTSDFSYTKKDITLNKLEMTTKESYLKGKVILKYNKDNHDFADFNNRVKFDVTIDSATFATNDIRYFYKELDKNQKFFLKSKIKGTLNNFYATNVDLKDY